MDQVLSNPRSRVLNGKWNSTLLALSAAVLIIAVTVVSAFAAGPAVATDAEFLIANPEMKVGQRYAGATSWPSQSAFLAANPELLVAQRYVPYGDLASPAVLSTNVSESASPVIETPSSAFLAENPELRIALQHTPGAWGQ